MTNKGGMMARLTGAGGLLIAGNEVLLVTEKESNESYCKREGALSLPIGIVEEGEAPGETAAREFFEETGIRVKIGRFLGKFCVGQGDAHIFLVDLEKGMEKFGKAELPNNWYKVETILDMNPVLVRPPTQSALVLTLGLRTFGFN
jgi:8-oxo-dGTP pyrophosphatase MutT (NUDIX family)